MENDEEIWRPYPDYPFIEVSNLGRVRTKDRTVTRSNGRKCFVKGRVLKQHLDRNGYMRVTFSTGNKTVHLFVHRAVAICFVPNPDKLPEINHIDCNRSNNATSNLEWCTSQYNTAYREKFGIPAKDATKVLRKPVIVINPETYEIFWFESRTEVERKLGIANANISKVIKGQRETAGGYWFCNADENAVEKTREKFGDEVAKKVKKLMLEN